MKMVLLILLTVTTALIAGATQFGPAATTATDEETMLSQHETTGETIGQITETTAVTTESRRLEAALSVYEYTAMSTEGIPCTTLREVRTAAYNLTIPMVATLTGMQQQGGDIVGIEETGSIVPAQHLLCFTDAGLTCGHMAFAKT